MHQNLRDIYTKPLQGGLSCSAGSGMLSIVFYFQPWEEAICSKNMEGTTMPWLPRTGSLTPVEVLIKAITRCAVSNKTMRLSSPLLRPSSAICSSASSCSGNSL